MAGDERLSTLVILEDDLTQIGVCLDRLMRESDAACTMLLDVSGILLGWRGAVDANKVEQLGVLLANGFVAARQVAAILGQPQFDAFLQQGKHQHILSQAVGNHWILVTIFEDRTTEGMVRLLSGKTSSELNRTLDRVRAESLAVSQTPERQRPRLGRSAESVLDQLFRDDEP